MSLNSVQSFVIENCNGPTIENGLNNVCLHPLSRTFTFTFSTSIVLIALLLLSPLICVSTSSEVVGCRNSEFFILTAGVGVGTEECTSGIVSAIFLPMLAKKLFIAFEIALGSVRIISSVVTIVEGVFLHLFLTFIISSIIFQILPEKFSFRSI